MPFLEIKCDITDGLESGMFDSMVLNLQPVAVYVSLGLVLKVSNATVNRQCYMTEP